MKRNTLWTESGEYITFKRLVDEKKTSNEQVERSNVWERSRGEWFLGIY